MCQVTHLTTVSLPLRCLGASVICCYKSLPLLCPEIIPLCPGGLGDSHPSLALLLCSHIPGLHGCTLRLVSVSWLHEFIHCYVIFFGCHGTVTHGCIAACDWRGTVDGCYPATFYYLQLGSTVWGRCMAMFCPHLSGLQPVGV